MSSKTTWSLVAVAGVVFALIFFIEHPFREARNQQATRKVLPTLNPEAVTEIIVHPADQLEVRAECKDHKWRLTKPIAYDGDTRAIESLIHALADLEWQARISAQELKDRPQAQAEFGLVTPQYSIVAFEGKTAHRLLIGTNSAMGDQVFVQVVGSDNVCLASADLLKVIPRNKDYWRETAIVKLDDLNYQSVKVRSGARTFELQRDEEGLWRMKFPLQARADSSKVEQLLKDLQNLRVGTFVSDEATDLEPFGLQPVSQAPDLEVSFCQNTNVLFALQVGTSPTNHPDQVYVRRLNTGNIVLAPREPLRSWQGSYTNFLDRHLISCSPSQIQSIEVHGEDTFVVARQPDGNWVVATAGTAHFDADPDLVSGFLSAFTNAQVEIEKTVVADFAGYGLAQPILQYRLRGETSNSSPTNLIAQIEFGTNLTNKIFERRVDEPLTVNSIPREYYDRLPRASWQLRNRRIWNFASSNVVAVTVQQAGATRKMIRDPEQNWTFAPGSFGKLNSFSLEETLHRLGELKAVWWSGNGDRGLEQFGFRETDHKVLLNVKNGDHVEALSIEFGKASPYLHPYAAVVSNGQRLVFEFPAQLYYDNVRADLTIPPSIRNAHQP